MFWLSSWAMMVIVMGGSRQAVPHSRRLTTGAAMLAAADRSPMSDRKRGIIKPLQRIRFWREMQAPKALVNAPPSSVSSLPANDTLEVLVLSIGRGRQEWIAAGSCNETMMVRWLCYELSEAVQAELIADAADKVNGTDAADISAEDAIRSLVRRERLRLGARSTHRRLRRQWRASRLLLRGIRLSDLGIRGRLRAEALAGAQPARSQHLTARAFRRELVSHVRRTRLLKPTKGEARHVLDYTRGEPMQMLSCPLRAPLSVCLGPIQD